MKVSSMKHSVEKWTRFRCCGSISADRLVFASDSYPYNLPVVYQTDEINSVAKSVPHVLQVECP